MTNNPVFLSGYVPVDGGKSLYTPCPLKKKKKRCKQIFKGGKFCFPKEKIHAVMMYQVTTTENHMQACKRDVSRTKTFLI